MIAGGKGVFRSQSVEVPTHLISRTRKRGGISTPTLTSNLPVTDLYGQESYAIVRFILCSKGAALALRPDHALRLMPSFSSR